MFGRARRIEFVKKLIFIAICLVLIGVSVYLTMASMTKDDNLNYILNLIIKK